VIQEPYNEREQEQSIPNGPEDKVMLLKGCHISAISFAVGNSLPGRDYSAVIMRGFEEGKCLERRWLALADQENARLWINRKSEFGSRVATVDHSVCSRSTGLRPLAFAQSAAATRPLNGMWLRRATTTGPAASPIRRA
jgi:hypothetical protein